MFLERRDLHVPCQSYDFAQMHGRSFQMSKMEQLLSPKGILNAQTSSKHAYLHFEPPALSDGSIPCVTPSLLDEIASWKNAGAIIKDVVDRL